MNYSIETVKKIKSNFTDLIIKNLDYFRTKKLGSFFGGMIVGALLVFLIKPDTKSISFWTLLGAILSFLIVLIYQKLQRFLEDLRSKTNMGKLIGPVNYSNEKCIIFITELWRDKNKDPIYLYDQITPVVGTSYLIGSGDSNALSYIYSFLMKAGKLNNDIIVVKSYERLKDYFDNNFISIGGLTNSSTEKLMNIYKEQMDYYFSKEGNLIIKDFGKIKRYIASNKQEDYGILMKKTGLNYPNKVIFIIAGIGDLGTSGAAYYFFDRATELAKEFGQYDFSIIVGVKRDFGEKSAYRFDFEKLAREYIEGGDYEGESNLQ